MATFLRNATFTRPPLHSFPKAVNSPSLTPHDTTASTLNPNHRVGPQAMSSYEVHTGRTFHSDLRHLGRSGIVTPWSPTSASIMCLGPLICIIQHVGPQEGCRLNVGTGWFEVRKESDHD
jgi:hypothetical protein